MMRISNTNIFYCLSITMSMLCASCNNTAIVDKNNTTVSHARWYEKDSANQITTTPQPQWAEMLRHDKGWIGADGIYSVATNGVEAPGKSDKTNTFFWFSDCIIGNIVADTLQSDWELLHNSVAYFNGNIPNPDSIHFFYRKDSAGHSLSMFEPHTPKSQPGNYYWLGDGFFNHALDSTTYIFAYLIKSVPGGIYPFDDIGLSLIAIPKNSKPPYTDQKQFDTPFFLKDSNGKGKVVFGVAVLPNTTGAGAPHPDGYIYVYGVRGAKKELLVSRVKDASFEKFDEWTFWDGAIWNPDINSAAALTDRVSNEMSVSFMDDGRVLATYELDTNSPDVVIQAGATPWGPFQPFKKVWETPEIYDCIDFYTYNAKAHPHLSKPGELLISYNVNAFNFLDQIVKHPYHLRPRFITVKYK